MVQVCCLQAGLLINSKKKTLTGKNGGKSYNLFLIIPNYTIIQTINGTKYFEYFDL